MSTWSALVDAAVLGAGRASVPEPVALLIGLTGDADDTTSLLRSAAAGSRARRAGPVPGPAGTCDPAG